MRKIMLLFVLIIIFGLQPVLGQKKHAHSVSTDMEFYNISERPKLGVDYSSVSNLKIASRKQNYHIGEMISIDLAILNTSNRPLLFKQLNESEINFKVTNDKGEEVEVVNYVLVLNGITSTSFNLMEAGTMEHFSYEMIGGCNSVELNELDKAREQLSKNEQNGPREMNKVIFERNMFVNVGLACLHIDHPGNYNVIVEISNNTVAFKYSKPSIKTVVGKATSKPLTITIVE